MKKILILISGILVFMGCSTNNNNGTVTVVPLAPSNLTGTVVSTTQINLSWTDNATNEDGYKIERKTGNGNYAVVGSMGADLTVFNDLGLTPYTTYTYRVYAYNSAGNSLQYSNEVSVTTSSVPVLTTTTVGSITTSTATSGGEISNDGGTPILSRGVVWSTSNNPTIALSTKTTDGSGSGNFSSNLTGLSLNTTYYVRAYATNANGTAYGNEVSFTTLNVDLVTGLVGYWPFNGNANDESGNGNNGTVYGASLTSDRFGNAGKAYSFDGLSNFIWAGLVSPLNGAAQSSINYWINSPLNFPTNSSGNYGTAIGHWVHNTQLNGPIGVQLTHISTGAVSVSLIGGQASNSNANITNANNWNCVTVVYNGNNSINQRIAVYINGLFVQYINMTNAPTTIGVGATRTYFGAACAPDGGDNAWAYFNGKLDDIRIYNRALSQSEITYLATH